MVQKELSAVRDLELLKQNLPNAADPIAQIIFPARLIDDALSIDAGQLDRDRRIRFFADVQLADTFRHPCLAASQNFLSFAAADRRTDRAMIQGDETFGVEPSQRLDLRSQRRQQQCLHQPVVVAECNSIGIIPR